MSHHLLSTSRLMLFLVAPANFFGPDFFMRPGLVLSHPYLLPRPREVLAPGAASVDADRFVYSPGGVHIAAAHCSP
jgi:hypothetical protein